MNRPRKLSLEALERRSLFAADADFMGPRLPFATDWIVQLQTDYSPDRATHGLGCPVSEMVGKEFHIARSLGKPGLLQIHIYSLEHSSPTDPIALASCKEVLSFSENAMVSVETMPDDPDFPSQVSLHNLGQFGAEIDADVDAIEAWEIQRGSLTVVTGIIDSGIDVTHPDLYLNIWVNQGEIPPELRTKLNDIDGDDLIALYDLNDPSNQTWAKDLNQTGYIDADDLLRDARWADGFDTDGNGFVDDFFGWNFRQATNEVFAPNNPFDEQGHGTHIAGIIGATGNNSLGITGVNWKTSLMALKFLDENNQGDLASAIAAINYASTMRSQFDVNVRVLNASWGQSGSSNAFLEKAIQVAGDDGILFVAAAGNGNVLGQGIDNDRSPFYPASLPSTTLLAVGASDASDRPASFSNFGAQSVDLFAPGVGIRSTLPRGRYGEANGTSMAAPFVAGTAALIWSELPNASVTEVREEIIASGDRLLSLSGLAVSGSRLNANTAIRSTRFSPQASVVDAADIHASGTETKFTVQ